MYLILQLIIFHVLILYVVQILSYDTNNYTRLLYPVYPRILDGGNSALAIRPMVSLKKLRTFPFDTGTYPTFCTGVILSDSKIVTAAHCVYRKRTFVERFRCLPVSRLKMVTKNMYVVAGDLYASMHYPARGGNEQWRRIRDVVAPHDYSFPEKDISLVFLKKPLIYDNEHKYIHHMPYPLDYLEYNSNHRCSVIGHGGGRQKVKSVRIMSNAECSKKHSKNMTRFICPEMNNNVLEEGDDGGLITCSFSGHKINTGKHFFHGEEVALGIACTKTPHGPIYTRVSEYTHFLNRNKATKTAGPMDCAVFCIILIYYNFYSY